MSDYLFRLNTPNISNPPPYDNSLPVKDCTNGQPNAEYTNYGDDNASVLYSIWSANQNTLGAQFSIQQNLVAAPGTNPICQGPANIFIFRHGEKSAELPNYSLNNNGIYRASQLVNFINLLAKDGYPISYIVSCNPCCYNTSDPSIRATQTVMMSSFMLNIPTFIYGGSQDYAPVCQALYPYPPNSSQVGQYDGLNIVICWEHSSIQQLCLNILNTAGLYGRIPVGPTNNDTKLYGDAFFNLTSVCKDGKYLCPADPSAPNYNSVYDVTQPDTPTIIGPNSYKYPYWNNYNFDNVYWFKLDNTTNYWDFQIFRQPCYTCFPSCGLEIGLYQPLNTQCSSSYLYYSNTAGDPAVSGPIENSCEVPSDWAV